MNQEYIIIDPRPLEAFKDKTFSGFKKREVLNTLMKCIEKGLIEPACYWVTECIVSGYCQELFEKLIVYNSKIIHINNPRLPEFLWRRYDCFLSSFNHINKKKKDQLIHLRNTQSVRNCLFDIITTMTLSSKAKRFDKYPKINELIDFQFNVIQSKLTATMQLLPSHIIKFTDPEELRIIMNEFLFHLKNVNGGYDQACYWVTWLVQWEKKNKKQKIKFEIEARDINEVNPKYCKDCIWLLWEIIFVETNLREDSIKKQIQSLYRFFRHDYTSGKRNTRLPLIYHAIGYLTLPIQFNIPIRKDHNIFLQTQCNINLMFKGKKGNEVKEYISPPKPIKKIVGHGKEINLSKINTLMDLDLMNR